MKKLRVLNFACIFCILFIFSSCGEKQVTVRTKEEVLRDFYVDLIAEKHEYANKIEGLKEKYEYMELIYNNKQKTNVLRVANGGDVINEKYVGGNWGAYSLVLDEESVPLKYDYVRDVLVANDETKREVYSVSKGGSFNYNGDYLGGEFGVYGKAKEGKKSKLLIDCKYDGIAYAFEKQAIVFNGQGNDSKWGMVEYVTGKEVVPLQYKLIEKFISNKSGIVVATFLGENNKWGAMNLETNKVIFEAEYTEAELYTKIDNMKSW